MPSYPYRKDQPYPGPRPPVSPARPDPSDRDWKISDQNDPFLMHKLANLFGRDDRRPVENDPTRLFSAGEPAPEEDETQEIDPVLSFEEFLQNADERYLIYREVERILADHSLSLGIADSQYKAVNPQTFFPALLSEKHRQGLSNEQRFIVLKVRKFLLTHIHDAWDFYCLYAYLESSPIPSGRFEDYYLILVASLYQEWQKRTRQQR